MTDFIIKYYFEKHLKSYRLHCKKLIAWLYVMFVSYDWLTTCYVKKTSKRKKKRWRFDQFQYQINKYLMHYHGSKSQKNCCRHWENLQLYSLRNILSQMVLILVHKKVNLTHTHNFNQRKMTKTESSNINYQLVHKLINLQSLWGVLKLNVLGDDMERCIEQNDTIPSL